MTPTHTSELGEMKKIIFSEILDRVIFVLKYLLQQISYVSEYVSTFTIHADFSRWSHTLDRNILLQAGNFATERIPLSGYFSLLMEEQYYQSQEFKTK